jgi:hypothetical protein
MTVLRLSARIVGCLVALLLIACAAGANAAEFALKRVLLSTGGVGYFEYEASVDGAAVLTLSVRRDQVDDVLKSIVVYDDKGGVGEIALPGEEPLRDVFRELPFDLGALTDPAALLNALRGAEVRIGGTRELQGRIVAIVAEPQALPNSGGVIQRHRLSLMTEQGLRSVILQDVDSLQFADARLQQQIDAALKALAANVQKERRALRVRTVGQGKRVLRVAYVVEAPLWKTAYRLTLSTEPDAKSADLQGWAVVENRSGEDWRDIELTLASGNPVTFRQALYAAYYVNRPEVPVEVFGRVLPKPDAGAIASAAPQQSEGKAEVEGSLDRPRAALARAMMQPVQPPAVTPVGAAAAGVSPQQLAQLTAAESTEAATQVTFRIPHPVSVPIGHSVLVPIISRSLPAERVALYQPSSHATNPFASVRISNDSGSGLPPGVLTLYEQGAGTTNYVGDARLNPLPDGERRLISYAIDQKLRIDRSQRAATSIAKGRIVDGLLQLNVVEQATTTYAINAPTNERRRLIIEHARLGGDWVLVEPDPKDAELVPNGWRLRHDLAAGATGKFVVTAQRPVSQRVELSTLNPQQIAYYAAATALSDAQRKAIVRLGELAAAVAESDRKLRAAETRRKDLDAEQTRIRNNLGAVPSSSDLHRRYLGLLSEQEDRIAKLAVETAAAREAIDQARVQLASYIKGLDL